MSCRLIVLFYILVTLLPYSGVILKPMPLLQMYNIKNTVKSVTKSFPQSLINDTSAKRPGRGMSTFYTRIINEGR